MINDPLKCWHFYNSMFLVMNSWWLIPTFQACDDPEVNSVPSTLLCKVHQLMMIDDIQSKLKDLCLQIHDSLGKQKTRDCFLVGNEFQNKSSVLKAINIAQLLSTKSSQQDHGITVIILKNSLPQKKTRLTHWKITILTVTQKPCKS